MPVISTLLPQATGQRRQQHGERAPQPEPEHHDPYQLSLGSGRARGPGPDAAATGLPQLLLHRRALRVRTGPPRCLLVGRLQRARAGSGLALARLHRGRRVALDRVGGRAGAQRRVPSAPNHRLRHPASARGEAIANA